MTRLYQKIRGLRQNLYDIETFAAYFADRSVKKDRTMLRTIILGSAVSVQGTFVCELPDGRIAVKVDNTVFAGQPVSKAA